jgi:hypothetical protein
VIGQPSALNGIGVESEASFAGSDLVNILTDHKEPVFQLGLLRWGKAKPYADKREADRIIMEPRFHRQFVRRDA